VGEGVVVGIADALDSGVGESGLSDVTS